MKLSTLEVLDSRMANDKAIASLALGDLSIMLSFVAFVILGIVSIMIPLVGLVAGVIGIMLSRKATKEIIETNEGGRGLATSGLYCSIITIALQILIILDLLVISAVATI